MNWQDPQHRQWYTGLQQQSANYWVNADGSQLINMENAFLPQADYYGKDFVVYNFSRSLMHWGFQLVRGDEPLLYICEAHIISLQRLVSDDRTYEYGVDIDNPEYVPRGPYLKKQPSDVTFDLSRRSIYNDITLR